MIGPSIGRDLAEYWLHRRAPNLKRSQKPPRARVETEEYLSSFDSLCGGDDSAPTLVPIASGLGAARAQSGRALRWRRSWARQRARRIFHV